MNGNDLAVFIMGMVGIILVGVACITFASILKNYPNSH